MSFTRVNPSGWLSNQPITPAQANQLDTDHANAVDGSGGGTYAPDYQWDGTHVFTTNPKLQGSSTWIDFDAARTIWRRVPLIYSVVNPSADAGNVVYDDGAVSSTAGVIKSVGVLTNIWFDVSAYIPTGSQLAGARISFAPAGSHTQTPGTMPVLALYKNDFGAGTLLQNKTDDIAPAGSSVAADITAYENWHEITLSLGTPEAAFNPAGKNAAAPYDLVQYLVAFSPESGTGALSAGWQLQGLAIQVSALTMEW